MLVHLYSILTTKQSIIFCASRFTADAITKRMTKAGYSIDSLHGKLDTQSRDQTIDRFRNSETKVLIATNVLARGIDVQSVNLVVNYDMPLDPSGNTDVETYLHRVGRTGRFGRKGLCINLIHDHTSWMHLSTLEEVQGITITRVPTQDRLEMERLLKLYLEE